MSDRRPCPACPDGNVWNTNGPTGKTCPVCNGAAEVNMDGSPVISRPRLPHSWPGLNYRRGEDE